MISYSLDVRRLSMFLPIYTLSIETRQSDTFRNFANSNTSKKVVLRIIVTCKNSIWALVQYFFVEPIHVPSPRTTCCDF